ncbi:methyltransferase [Kribbella sp. ALI-6-A]|uniref:methyltransferase n=1 Tax=Kribbella sp. ALI-6-A TaxID=1933817 RepID=UPI000A075E90|nr:methyltransferase [Kribbella sp. ALI-6-A]
MDSLLVIDDAWSASRALQPIERGSRLLWQGDWHNGRQVVAAIKRRLRPSATGFADYRRQRGRQVRAVNAVLVALTSQYDVELRRAPDVQQACREAYGPPTGDRLVPLQELLGVIGAHQLRRRGVEVPALGARIHPHYGVFAPTRSEYVELVANTPSRSERAFDIGTGTGVLAAVLARRGLRVTATDLDPRAVECARDNFRRLNLPADVLRTDLFPPGRADLIVCNPPWIPARPITPLDRAVYDEDSRMLTRFLDGARHHLEPGGEVWLILSDLAEHLGLRSRADLLAMVDRAGLIVAGRADIATRHRRSWDRGDALAAARGKEVTSLWRLAEVDRPPGS